MTMRVSLAPARRQSLFDGKTPAPLTVGGARVILGNVSSLDGLVSPIKPSAITLFGPRGAALAAEGGPLFVCDTGHHRLLIWSRTPAHDGTAADMHIGQPNFESEGRNAKGGPGSTTLNVPTGVSVSGEVLAVADAWNHRVLIWHGLPTRSNQPADIVLGQRDFESGLANRGAAAAADTLNWCYGVTIADGALWVADTGNRRVLKWNRIPTESGAPADLVLGETDFVTRDGNAGRAVADAGMTWPHSVVVADRRLLIADAGNNRVMVWDELPEANGAPCSFVLGQKSFASIDHNAGSYYPTSATLNMPYSVARVGNRVAIADTANSRIVAHDISDLHMFAGARYLAGQATFCDKGDNRWRFPQRDSLCWPYGIAACGSTMVVADSGNNRVMLWDVSP
ncbi:MAG: NHL repeat-containing protein [Hyphomicrobium sp.]|uniref:NHL repeat-containing protein n=1 Tax=Hyphomicrobium sp. TaxID=82 RepID=UPI0039E6D280